MSVLISFVLPPRAIRMRLLLALNLCGRTVRTFEANKILT